MRVNGYNSYLSYMKDDLSSYLMIFWQSASTLINWCILIFFYYRLFLFQWCHTKRRTQICRKKQFTNPFKWKFSWKDVTSSPANVWLERVGIPYCYTLYDTPHPATSNSPLRGRLARSISPNSGDHRIAFRYKNDVPYCLWPPLTRTVRESGVLTVNVFRIMGEVCFICLWCSLLRTRFLCLLFPIIKKKRIFLR